MKSRLIIGTAIGTLGILVGFLFSPIFGALILIFGIIVYFNREEDEIEQIKEVSKKPKNFLKKLNKSIKKKEKKKK